MKAAKTRIPKRKRQTAHVDIAQQLEVVNVLVPKPHEVKSYISRHTKLGRLLPDICAQVRQAFGPDEELSLELYCDPEIADRYLTLYVRQKNYEPQILDRIDAVGRRFDEALENVSGYLLIMTDFCFPRGQDPASACDFLRLPAR